MTSYFTLSEGATLIACALGLIAGIVIIVRAKRPSKWDEPANQRRHKEAVRKARQKAHENDSRNI